MLSFEAPKIRLLHSLSIEIETMQVLDFCVFPKPEYDVPIFCANFFTSGNANKILLDLNPFHDIISQRNYKEKYYKGLMPLGVKYAELLPWGGKLTSESLKFFSPIMLWTKFTSSQCNHDVLFSTFMDYYKAFQLMKEAAEEADPSGLNCNCEAQHRYLTWRAEKDPGHRVLKKLIGETQTTELLRNFLFNGIDKLGSKSFLDYFPEYRCEDGTVNGKRSMVGKSLESRPFWDTNGEFIVDCQVFTLVSSSWKAITKPPECPPSQLSFWNQFRYLHTEMLAGRLTVMILIALARLLHFIWENNSVFFLSGFKSEYE
ncbi:hypothetical protein FNV43_RR04601 [Rhamnella rubrinervis]|uniref:Phytochromobilin:ferredoxin oxidoreductase, chloroplastic n=1 Tax=Rhamnella rubrinervis TaxID=2594499 RepID=A0A8K0HM93_9ROSA|nr:hypothetical protein FNV43_RR04601 [Rhamnella rubrinervis]